VVVVGLPGLDDTACVLDGELVITAPRPFDFPALMMRLHPAASRVARLRRETPAKLIAFDAVVAGGEDLRDVAFEVRRRRLEDIVDRSAVDLTPSTRDGSLARQWVDEPPLGTDGVVVKRADLRYVEGKREMVKVKRNHTVDCVVGGMRLVGGGDRAVSSLLLGLFDGDALVHVGVASSFRAPVRRELFDALRVDVVPLAGHPWADGFLVEGGPTGRLLGAAGRWTPDLALDWVPLRPERVCEVAHDQVDGGRFRNPARFVRWRPDRDPRSCTVDQLRRPADG
jgi:ATP-dependent DNA ligase